MNGVYYDKRNNKWKATPRLCGTTRYLGNYATEEEAEAVKNAYMHKIKDAENPLLSWLADIFPQYGSKSTIFLPSCLNAIKDYLSESSKFSVEAYVTAYVKKRYGQVGNTTLKQIHQAEQIVAGMPSYMYEYLFQGLAYNSTLKCPSYYRMRETYHGIFPKKFDLGGERNDD